MPLPFLSPLQGQSSQFSPGRASLVRREGGPERRLYSTVRDTPALPLTSLIGRYVSTGNEFVSDGVSIVVSLAMSTLLTGANWLRSQ